MQPIFELGLNPWVMYYSTNVLPTSTTLYRVPVPYHNILNERQIYINYDAFSIIQTSYQKLTYLELA